MIRLRQLLREFEAGKLLWADPENLRRSGDFEQFLNKVYGGEMEPNTPEEEAALKRIEDYILNNELKTPAGVRTLNQPKKFIKDLLKLKPNFPAMLDPLYNNPLLNNDSYIYRGMTAELPRIIRTIQQAKSFEKVSIGPQSNNYILIDRPRVTIKSRAKGFMSFTTGTRTKGGPIIADMFVGQNLWADRSRWGVIIRARYSDIADKALLNPAFIEAVGGWGESEIWVLEGRIVPDVLYIRDPFDWADGDLFAANEVKNNEVKNALYANPNFLPRRRS